MLFQSLLHINSLIKYYSNVGDFLYDYVRLALVFIVYFDAHIRVQYFYALILLPQFK